MTHPVINHIDDVLPHISGRDEFVVAKRDGYQVIDYNFALTDTFDDPVRLELRGIKFDADGRILARPLHKFFNIGERPETQPELLDFAAPHTIMTKLDGSMIHPAIVGGELVFMTRMGRTDVARKAERQFLPGDRPQHKGWLRDCLHALCDRGWTPIFEFTAPDNRIVISYDHAQLTLLAMRRMDTGVYEDRKALTGWAEYLGLPLVAEHNAVHLSGRAFLDFARTVTGMEGFVVRFASGLWVKAKGEDYVLKHKAKDSVLQEKNVLALILRGELDDVLPLLEPADRRNLEIYRDRVVMGMRTAADRVANHVFAGADLDQKTFATVHQLMIDERLRPLAYQIRAGAMPSTAVEHAIARNLGSQSAVDSVRHLFDARFDLAAANDNTETAVAA